MPVLVLFTLDPDRADELFPCGEEGRNVRASAKAEELVRRWLKVSADDKLDWHLPDAFSVRYGSNYIASCRNGDTTVRFLSTYGEWKEGDDRC